MNRAGLKQLNEVLEGTRRWCVIRGDAEEVLSRIPDHAITCSINDPPYSAKVHGKQRRVMTGGNGDHSTKHKKGVIVEKSLGFDHLEPETMAYVGAHLGRVTERWNLVFTDVESSKAWELALAPRAKHVRVGAWIKVNGQPQLTGDRPAVGFEAIEIAHNLKVTTWWNGGGHPAVWAFPIATDRSSSGKRLHPTQKPLGLMLKLVSQFTDGPGPRFFSGRRRRPEGWPGDLVLDCFAGSGTTGVAALRLGRRCILVEREKKWADVARAQLEAESKVLDLSAMNARQLPLLELFGSGARVPA